MFLALAFDFVKLESLASKQKPEVPERFRKLRGMWSGLRKHLVEVDFIIIFLIGREVLSAVIPRFPAVLVVRASVL